MIRSLRHLQIIHRRIAVGSVLIAVLLFPATVSDVPKAVKGWRDAVLWAGRFLPTLIFALAVLLLVFALFGPRLLALVGVGPRVPMARASAPIPALVVVNRGENPNVRFTTNASSELFIDLGGRPSRLHFTEPVKRTLRDEDLPKTLRKRGKQLFRVVRFTDSGFLITEQTPNLRVAALIYYDDSEDKS